MDKPKVTITAPVRAPGRELPAKWLKEQAEYPNSIEGRYAAAAVRLCAFELEAALASQPEEPQDSLQSGWYYYDGKRFIKDGLETASPAPTQVCPTCGHLPEMCDCMAAEAPAPDTRAKAQAEAQPPQMTWQQQLALWIDANEFDGYEYEADSSERMIDADRLRAWLAEHMEAAK